MTRRGQSRVAWVVAAGTVLLHATAVVLAPPAARWQAALDGAPLLGVAGALIVSRRGNVVGWLLVIAGASFGLNEAAVVYAYRSLVASPGALPAAQWAGWVSSWVWLPGFAAAVFLLPLVFPDGRLLSSRWRPLAWLLVGLALLQLPTYALRPGPLLLTDPVTSLDVAVGQNPVGVAAIGPVRGLIDMIATVLFFPSLIALIAAVVVRYRRAGGIERYQLRWFLFAVALQPVSFAISTLIAATVLASEQWLILSDLLLLTVPLAIGIAVLRYRLYEIDRIISRSLTYAVVTAVLGSVYVAVAILPSAALDIPSDVLVAVATLAAAGLFVPVRRRVQSAVDRRFNRARYDAARVVEGFGARLREPLDVDNVSSDIRGVVDATMQPVHVALWLRSSGGPT